MAHNFKCRQLDEEEKALLLALAEGVFDSMNGGGEYEATQIAMLARTAYIMGLMRREGLLRDLYDAHSHVSTDLTIPGVVKSVMEFDDLDLTTWMARLVEELS